MRQNPHVRICGGLGSATTLVYPTVPLVRARDQTIRSLPTFSVVTWSSASTRPPTA